MPKLSAALLAALLAPGQALAQTAPLFDGVRGRAPEFRIEAAGELKGAPQGWTPAPPDQEPGDANPGAPERSGFWDRLQRGTFDQICKNIRLRAGQRVDLPGYGSTGVQVDRRLERTAAGTFALVDEAQLDVSAGWGQSVFEEDAGGVGISVGASIRGSSMVVRPLGTKKSCDEIGRLVNVFDLKAALPLSPERVSKMAVGELWRLPLSITVSGGLGGHLADVPVSVSLGRGKEGRAAVTLYRLAQDQVRFRLRIDQADIRSKGGEVVYTLPGAALGFPETNVIIVEQLTKLVNRQIARSLSRYLTTRLGLSTGTRQGRMIMVEFLLDPRDQAQMAALRELMRGDLNALRILGELVKKAGSALTGDKPAAEEAGEIVGRHAEGLGRDSTFTGADDYTRESSRFWFKLPLIVDHENVSGRERDHIVILDETGKEHDVYKADKVKDTGFIDIPFLGQMTKHTTQRTAQVMTSRDKDGNVQEPVAVFVRQEGFLRKSASDAREMAEEADAIARLIGARGGAGDPSMGLPVETLFPKDQLYLPEQPGPRGDQTGPRPKDYHRGVSAFTLTFSRKAVEDIVSAPAEVVLKSYANALGYAEREMMARVMPLLSVDAAGKVSYSEKAALKALGYDGWHDEEARNAMGELSRLAAGASSVLRDLASARDGKDATERAQKFLAVMAGDGDSGMAYEDILKVLVQLVDPADVSGEFFVAVEKRRKDEKDVTARLLLNGKTADGAIIADTARARARFAEPSILVD